jgi:rubrerythrin
MKEFFDSGGARNLTNPVEIMKAAISAELDAASLYRGFAEKIEDKKAKEVLNSVADEEDVHAGEFEVILEKLQPTFRGLAKKGEGEVMKESTNVEENAKKLFGKSYKDLTPEEKEKADKEAMISFWLGENYKETATSNDEDSWMRKMFKAGATPEEIAGTFKVQYGRDLPVSQVRYTVLGVPFAGKEATFNPRKDYDDIAKKMFGKKFDDLTDKERDEVHMEYELDTEHYREEELLKESINSTWDSSTDREKINWARKAGITKDIIDMNFADLGKGEQDKLWVVYVEGGNADVKEKLKNKTFKEWINELKIRL